jgi:predicted nucleic acid-binding protein
MTVQLGWLDTNIFVHSLFPNDQPYPRCQAILKALDEGRAEAWVDVGVLHELTYSLMRMRLFPSRLGAYTYIEEIISSGSIYADDKQALLDTTYRWATTGAGFIDSWLAVLAEGRGLPICSANRRDFPAHLDNTYVTANLEEVEEGA